MNLTNERKVKSWQIGGTSKTSYDSAPRYIIISNRNNNNNNNNNNDNNNNNSNNNNSTPSLIENFVLFMEKELFNSINFSKF